MIETVFHVSQVLNQGLMLYTLNMRLDYNERWLKKYDYRRMKTNYLKYQIGRGEHAKNRILYALVRMS